MKLFYREYGAGKPLIIAHGLFGMSDNWIPIAKKLAEKFKVYILDMRNHGKSPHSEIHTYEAMSKDIYEFIEDKKIEQATFIGHSMGGKAVLQFAENHPSNVREMIIVDISPKEYIPSENFFKKALNHKLLLENLMKIKLQDFNTRKKLSKFLETEIKNYFLIQLILKNIKKEKEGFQWKINLNTIYFHLDAMRKEIKLSKNVKMIKTLFLFGGNSPYFRKEDKIFIKEHFINYEIKIVSEAGHLIHIDKENKFINLVLSFT